MIKNNKLLNHRKRSFNDYLAIKILKDISNQKDISLIKSSYLNKLNLNDFPRILSCFHTFINKSHQEDLVKLILLSRSSQEIDLACSNAATILAKSDFIFKDIDFSQIRIPKADLSQRLFVNLNFEGSYLKEVNFMQSQFQNVNFKNCDLSCANFGSFKKLTSIKGKGLRFSSDDQHFWYKNDDSILEIELASQKIINEYKLIGFVSTNISEIHNLRYNWSSASVHGQYIKLWDKCDENLIYEINIHRLVISSNFRFIVALDANSTVLSWDLDKQMQFLGTSKEFTYRGERILFSPSNRCLAVIRAESISLIETEKWTLLRKIPGDFPIKSIYAISYCCRKIAYLYFNEIYLLDTITSKKIILHSPPSGKLLCLSFSPCGKFLAFGLTATYGFILNIKSNQIFQVFSGFESYPESIMFSKSGKYISWSDFNGNIRIYEFSPKFCYNNKNRHFNISSIKVSPKGKYLITSNWISSILWDLNNFNPKQIKELMGHSATSKFVFSPYETYLLRVLNNKVEIYDIKRDFLIKVLSMPNNYIHNYLFSYCENYLICLNINAYEYFRISDFLITRKINFPSRYWSRIEFSECGNYDFWCDNKNIYIWDLVKGKFMKNIELEQENYVNHFCAATSLLSKIAFYFEKKSCIYVLDIETGEIINIPIILEEKSWSWCFVGCNGTEIAGGFSNGLCMIWDIKTKVVKQQLRSLFLRNIKWIKAVDGHIIIGEDDKVEIFNLAQLI